MLRANNDTKGGILPRLTGGTILRRRADVERIRAEKERLWVKGLQDTGIVDYNSDAMILTKMKSGGVSRIGVVVWYQKNDGVWVAEGKHSVPSL